MKRVCLVAANMREAEHYKYELLRAQDNRFTGRRIELVTPQNGHRSLRGLGPDTAIYVMDCALREDLVQQARLRETLAWLKFKGVPVKRLPCGRGRRTNDNENGDK